CDERLKDGEAARIEGVARGRVLACRSMPRRPFVRAGLLALSAFAVALPAHAADAAAAIARGDASWERRAEGAQGGRAARPPIAAAVAAYEEAVKAAPASLEASWKLLRALWFEGEYVAASQEEKQRVFGRGKA